MKQVPPGIWDPTEQDPDNHVKVTLQTLRGEPGYSHSSSLSPGLEQQTENLSSVNIRALAVGGQGPSAGPDSYSVGV